MVFRCVWLLSFLFLCMSQSCLAGDRFSFNPVNPFSRKLCPSCGFYPSFRNSLAAQAQISFSQAESQSRLSDESDHAAGELIHPGRNNKYNKAWIVLTAAIMVLLVSTTWHMTKPNRLLEEEQENNGENTPLVQIKSDDSDYIEPRFTINVIRVVRRFFCLENKITNQVGSQDLHLFTLDDIHMATKHFSIENKLGGGGFGCVYKAQFANGEVYAVKKLTRSVASGEEMREFLDEANIISKLRHKNLIRLLGYCTERNELLLVYEYMANRSLDDVLFDSTRSVLLEWKMRMSIINGIAQGLLYLHEDSKYKIIHGSLKPCNILLDDEMNLKISGFGLSGIFNDHESIVTTLINAGTIGYFAPEYVLRGQISIKSDVFSFGVLLLEIITVKKSSKLYILEHGLRVLDYIWELWCDGKALELMDQALLQACDRIELQRCIHIGLLCVQEDPTNRPTMSSVVSMLASDGLLPEPTQPAYFYRRSIARSSRFLSDIESSF